MTKRFQSPLHLLFLGAVSAFARPAAAQAVVAPSPLEQSMEATPAAPGQQKYDGVVPGPAGKNPLPALPKAGAYLVWTGFQMTDTGSRVFLQTTQGVQFAVDAGRPGKSGKSTLAIKLEACRIFMANNRRRIDTRYFATPVSNVSARQKGHDVEVRIALREVANATPHTEPGPEGTQFVVLDFPLGKATPEPSPLQDMAKASGLTDGNEAAAAEASDEPAATAPKKKARKSKR
jgi:hypothetical protein